MCLMKGCGLRFAGDIKLYMAHAPYFLHKIEKNLNSKRLNHKGFRKMIVELVCLDLIGSCTKLFQDRLLKALISNHEEIKHQNRCPG